jgi:L-rhamnose mutarotase
MRRVCFTLRVDPARLAEYREPHARMWPEILADGRTDRGMHVLDKVFNLDAQLGSADRDWPGRIGDAR